MGPRSRLWLNSSGNRNAVERLLQVEVLAIENQQEVFTAMVALKQGRDHLRTH